MSLELLAKDHELNLLRSAYGSLIEQPMKFLETIDIEKLPVDDITKTLLAKWLHEDHSELIYKMTARVILNTSVTAQALTGMMFSKVRNNPIRGTIIDLMLNAICKNAFIKVKRIGMYLHFYSTNKLSQEILE